MAQSWRDLLFAHWPVAPDALRPLIPPQLELQAFHKQCWVGVVPFRMSGVRPRWLPAIAGTSCFPELNVRTYVVCGGKPGVYFFSLDAANRLAVKTARFLYHLPYFHADMRSDDTGEEIVSRSKRRKTPNSKDIPASGKGEPPLAPRRAWRGTVLPLYHGQPQRLPRRDSSRALAFATRRRHPGEYHGPAAGIQLETNLAALRELDV
jgi:hypothetical protein